MKAFNSDKLPLCLFLCCINATLLLLTLLATAHPPSRSSTGDSYAPHDSHISLIKYMPMRKMAMASSLVKDLPLHQYHLNRALHHGTAQLRLSKFISARRSLLHLAEGHQEMSTTKVAPTGANHAAATTSANVPHDHLPHHEVDVSATFHVDYSGPKTHPPKNN